MRKIRPAVIALLAGGVAWTHATGQGFTYLRQLTGARGAGWYQVFLPPEVQAKTKSGWADLRILAPTEAGDTLEIPYALVDPGRETVNQERPLKIINKSNQHGKWFYTLDNDAKSTLNEIDLTFNRTNFDWRVQLQGSHDQQEWFGILTNYRVLSLRNETTDFTFTLLKFPPCNFRYFRISLAADTDPQLQGAITRLELNDPKRYFTYQHLKLSEAKDKKTKQTAWTLKLPEKLPASLVKVFVKDTTDYIRPVHIQRALEKQGTGETVFITIGHGTLSSFGKNEFIIPSTLTQELKLIIEEGDNQPLRIDSIQIKTHLQEMLVRLPEASEYLMAYGYPALQPPQYDLAEILAQHNPKLEGELTAGPEMKVTHSGEQSGNWWEKDLFLYGLMALVILLLGGFSITMMRRKV